MTFKKYKSMPKSQVISYLNLGEYKFIYDALKDRKTFSYIDENSNINLVANCGNSDMITILKAKKSVYVDKHNLGVLIQIKFLDNGCNFDFIFDVYNEEDASMLDKIISSENNIIITFLKNDGKGLSKVFHIDFELEDSLKERIEYVKYITYNLHYPRINKLEAKNENSIFLEYEYNKSIIFSVIEACDKLTKWKSADDFQIYIYDEETIKLYILGNCKNINFIKAELKSYNLLKEGEELSKGIPLLKYKKGYLSFYDYNSEAVH